MSGSSSFTFLHIKEIEMERRKSFAVICFLAFLGVFFVSAQASADKIADWKKLVELNGSFAPFRSSSSATHDAEFVSGWKKWHDEFTPFAKQFIEKYGATREELQKSFEGTDAPEGVYVNPANLVDLLTLDSDAHQKVIAGWLKKEGDEVFARWEAMKDPPKEKLELKADYAGRALSKYSMAEELDSGIAGDDKAKAESALKESEAALKKTMEALKWPGHNPDFQGPGDPDVLAAEALKLLRKMKAEGKQWTKPEYDDEHIPVAACVTGSKWDVWKKEPLTQKPTQYSLKFFVAFKGTQDPDIAYGYHMFFYTDEKSGVKMEPPFFYCNSQQYAKFKMLMDNVPAGSGGGECAASTGFFGVIFRLLLSLLLIAGGIIAWNEFLRAKFPQLSSLYDTLTKKKEMLGYALLIVGILALLRTAVLSLAPLADILPQLTALALGLALVSVKDLEQKVGSEKMQSTLSRLEALGNTLQPHQVLLGKVALALGIIHLILGCIVLF